MKSYKSILTKHFVGEGNDARSYITRITGLIPTKDNKGAWYVFNNESHVQLNSLENIKTFLLNIIHNGSCNGLPKEIGGIEDKTISSFVINLKEIGNIDSYINDFVIQFSEVELEETDKETKDEAIEARNREIAATIIDIIRDFKTHYYEQFKDYPIVYFDVFSPGYCDGYLTMLRNTNSIFDFVRMQGYSVTEDIKVGGSTIESGINVGYVRPAPFTLGPIVFNPIGNDTVDISADGMIVNYIGLLRDDPKKFKGFRVYLTVNFKPNSIDGRFIGKAQETYDTFKRFIDETKKQAKNGSDIDYQELKFLLDSIKVEIQGENPEKIKANDIATIFYKAFTNLTLGDIENIVNSESYIDGSSFIIKSDAECEVSFKHDNECRLIPLFSNYQLK